MNITLSKTALVALDQYRNQRKIRTRAKALETALLELTNEIVLTAQEKSLLETRLQEAKDGNVVSIEVILTTFPSVKLQKQQESSFSWYPIQARVHQCCSQRTWAFGAG
jgi:hypothetical protein